MNLSRKLPTDMTWGKKILHLNMAFDVILRVFDLHNDKLFEEDASKIELSLQMLVSNYRVVRRCDIHQKINILKYIFDNFINVKSKPTKDKKKYMDYNQDAKYIYSSFMMDYGIDLFEQHGKLDWRKFVFLVNGLSEQTKLREIINIRGRVVPAATKYNSAEIKSIIEAKAYYALEFTDEEMTGQYQQGLSKLAGMLERLAGG